MNINVGQLLTFRANTFPHQEAVVDLYRKTRFTYEEFNQRVNQLVRWFKENNINKEDRIAIISKNSTSLAIILYAAAKAGVIVLPINWRLQVDELCYILQDSSPKVVFYEDVFDEKIIQLKTKEFAFQFTFVRIGVQSTSCKEVSFESIFNDQPADEPEIESSGYDPFIIMYTSGTTGRPKGVLLSHDNVWANAIGVSTFLDWRAGDRFLSVAPMFHIGGIILDVVSLIQGSTVVYMHEFHPSYIWDVIEQEQITQFMSVPVMLKLMLKTPDWVKKNIDSLRYILCGASAVPPELIEQYHSFEIPIVQVYGCTEYSGAISLWSQETGLNTHDRTGKPLFHTEVKIVEPGTNIEVKTGQIGEVICRGPCIFKEYWGQPIETEKVILDGWYYTGDLGKLDEQGYLTIIDRYKDMIISGGENIYPAEIEAVLQNMEGIQEVAVIGIPDEKWGETPKIYVVKAPGSTITQQEVLEFCQSRLAKYKCGKEVEFIDELPKNSVGKVLKTELRKLAIKKQNKEADDL